MPLSPRLRRRHHQHSVRHAVAAVLAVADAAQARAIAIGEGSVRHGSGYFAAAALLLLLPLVLLLKRHTKLREEELRIK